MDKPAQRPEGKLLRTYIDRRNISVRALARRTDMSEARIRQIVNGYASAGRGQYIDVVAPASTLADLAYHLDIPLEELQSVGRADAGRELVERAFEWQKSRAEGEPGDSDAEVASDASIDTPVTAENLDPRLNNIERQIDALWRRIDELGGSSASVEVGATGAGVAQMRPRTGPPEPPEEAPAPPLDAAANDPGVPSVGEQKRDRQDRAAEETD